MKGKIIVFLLSMLLTMSMYAFVGSTCAESSDVRIRFNASAVGECFVGYGGPGGPGYPSPYEWYGLGKGVAGISGFANAVPFPGTYLGILGDVYLADYVDAHGSISLDWTEENGDTHFVRARLYSVASTGLGLFIPKADVFSVPAAGQPDSIIKTLGLTGIHRSGSSIERISGMALFMVYPVGFSPFTPPISLMGVAVYFGSDISERLYMAYWLNEQTNLPIAGPESPTILVPAADVFRHTVDIM
jgi:hypothetical protein